MTVPPTSLPSYRIGIPAYHTVEVDTMVSLSRLTMAHKAPMDVMTACMVDMSREEISERFLKSKKEDYLLFIDTDMTFIPQDVEKLLWDMEQDKKIGCIGGICVNRDGSHKPVVKWIKDDKYISGKELYDRVVKYMKYKEVRGVDFMGTGFMVIRRKVLEDIPRPWFMAGYDERRNFLGEDVYFIRKVRQAGWKTCIDFGVQVGHIGKIVFYPDILLKHQPEVLKDEKEVVNA